MIVLLEFPGSIGRASVPGAVQPVKAVAATHKKTGISRCPFFIAAMASEANQFAVFQYAFLRVVKHLRAV